MKKRPLSLIEVCIALGLAALVISFLFSSLLQTIRMSRSLATLKDQVLETSLVHSRLLHIFSTADPTSFQFDENRISFSFENGLDPAFVFSGKQNAEIYLQKPHTLSLDIFTKNKLQTETLLTDVETLSWKPTLPFFLTLQLKQTYSEPCEFVFFFSDRSSS